MNVAVLLAGIADPKWPLDGKHPRILSPFDESALEVALKLRDVDAGTSIAMLVAGDARDEALVRAAASHRPDHLRRVEIPVALEWDIRAQAVLWRSVLSQLPLAPDLVVMGREFGDRDDGAFPAVLADTLGAGFVGLAQEIQHGDAVVRVMRERGMVEERIEAPLPLVASITNDRRNRLRHPLMKNVMMAKKASIETVACAADTAPAVVLESLAAAEPVKRAARCRMIEGSVEERARALAEFLSPWRAQS